MLKPLVKWLILLLAGVVLLQLAWLVRIALMTAIDPQSTAFQRSEAWRIQRVTGELRWTHQWVGYADISDNLKRAVIASEDGGFVDHGGVDWDAIDGACRRNEKSEAKASAAPAKSGKPVRAPKIVGGSTITQQLAKNLLLSGERNLTRKAQELVLTMALEAFLSKERVLEIYLNSVEWGEGVFGAEAASQHYFKKPAKSLTAYEAARLAVMLPAPKRYEKTPRSAYLSGRAQTIATRMGDVELP